MRTPARAAASKANGERSGGRPPKGVSRVLWRQVLERCRSEGLTVTELYTRLFTSYVSDGAGGYATRPGGLIDATDPRLATTPGRARRQRTEVERDGDESFPSGLTLETLAEHAGMTLTAFCPACDRYATLRMQDRPTPPAVPGVRGPDREPAPQR